MSHNLDMNQIVNDPFANGFEFIAQVALVSPAFQPRGSALVRTYRSIWEDLTIQIHAATGNYRVRGAQRPDERYSEYGDWQQANSNG